MFKWCTSGSPNSAPWRIFGKEGNRLEQIGQMKHRPSNADLETVFYNGASSTMVYEEPLALKAFQKAYRGCVAAQAAMS